VYFSQPVEMAVVYKYDGNFEEITELKALKNSALSEVQLVRVYDTSTKIPASIVLVDTPGLSSLDPKHREALTGHLPHADIILVAVDINQGVTASLLDFLKMAELARRRVYMWSLPRAIVNRKPNRNRYGATFGIIQRLP
jgi:hypothetical protein